MPTKTKAATVPYLSGWCAPGKPLPHTRCKGGHDANPDKTWNPCTCSCHTQTPAGEAAPDLPPSSVQRNHSSPAGPPTIGTQGFHPEIPEEDYHADRSSLSQSGAKLILKAPALFRYRQDHPEFKDAFDFGHAAHALVLGIGAPIAALDANDKRGKAWIEHKAAARETGAIPLLAKEAAVVTAMADMLSSHRLAMRLLSDGQPEVSAYCEDPESGVMRRARFDWLGTSVLTDYKTTVSSDPVDLAGRYGTVKKWGYDSQAAWYTDLARDLGHPADAFALIFQMKEPPHLVTVAYIDDRDLGEARERNRVALERFRDCTESGEWPGYLPDDTAARVSLTDQRFEQERVV